MVKYKNISDNEGDVYLNNRPLVTVPLQRTVVSTVDKLDTKQGDTIIEVLEMKIHPKIILTTIPQTIPRM